MSALFAIVLAAAVGYLWWRGSPSAASSTKQPQTVVEPKGADSSIGGGDVELWGDTETVLDSKGSINDFSIVEEDERDIGVAITVG